MEKTLDSIVKKNTINSSELGGSKGINEGAPVLGSFGFAGERYFNAIGSEYNYASGEAISSIQISIDGNNAKINTLQQRYSFLQSEMARLDNVLKGITLNSKRRPYITEQESKRAEMNGIPAQIDSLKSQNEALNKQIDQIRLDEAKAVQAKAEQDLREAQAKAQANQAEIDKQLASKGINPEAARIEANANAEAVKIAASAKAQADSNVAQLKASTSGRNKTFLVVGSVLALTIITILVIKKLKKKN